MQLCIKERATTHDEERAQRIFIGTLFADQGTLYRVVAASRDQQDRLLLASVKEDAMENTSGSGEQEDELLTVREVAKQLRVDDTTVRRWLKKGIMEGVFLPSGSRYNTYRIRRSTLEQILAGRA